MRILAHFLALLLFNFSLYAQWSPQQSGVNNNLLSVCFVNENTGLICGTGGLILKTTNGGSLWNSVENEFNLNLNSIYFVNEKTGWIAGDEGLLLKTSNGGETWVKMESGTSLDLQSVFFVDTQIGWAVGDAQRIIFTTNGGATWNIETYSPYDPSVTFYSVFFTDPNTGWIVGDGANILSKSTISSDWISAKLDGISEFTRYNSAYFLNKNIGWIVGRKASLVFSKLEILKTIDGGKTWEINKPDSNDELGLESLLSVQFVSETLGWAVGQKGKIIRSLDGGYNWHLQKSGSSATLWSVFMVNDQKGWIVGNGGLILSTKTGGDLVSNVSSNEHAIPESALLHQNYPNPFNATTRIEFEIPQQARVSLKIYNLVGSEVANVLDDEMEMGKHHISFDAHSLPSGIYYYKLFSDGYSKTKKMILLR